MVDSKTEAGQGQQNQEDDTHGTINLQIAWHQPTLSDPPRLAEDNTNYDRDHQGQGSLGPRLSLDVMWSKSLQGYQLGKRVVIQSSKKERRQVEKSL